MASCTKCGATLVAQARFCASCGSPVSVAGSVPPQAAVRSNPKPAPDPFAQTVLKEEPEPMLAKLPPAAVSPMAASVMAHAQPVRSSATPGQLQGIAAAPGQGRVPTDQQAPLPMAMQAFPPGTLVLVYWADGNRYPGTVLQATPTHVFVVFPNGTQQWIDARYVSANG
jgi:hypothetical protein